MTPMVDLGFLLIAFFVVTTELSKPHVANLIMPHDGTDMPVANSNALTLLLDKGNTIYYYHGNWEEAVVNHGIIQTNFDIRKGIGNVIRQKQNYLLNAGISAEGKNGLILLIKPGSQSTYEELLYAFDETLINDIKHYAILKPTKAESDFLKTSRK